MQKNCPEKLCFILLKAIINKIYKKIKFKY